MSFRSTESVLESEGGPRGRRQGVFEIVEDDPFDRDAEARKRGELLFDLCPLLVLPFEGSLHFRETVVDVGKHARSPFGCFSAVAPSSVAPRRRLRGFVFGASDRALV
jgi:hypothetical protein